MRPFAYFYPSYPLPGYHATNTGRAFEGTSFYTGTGTAVPGKSADSIFSQKRLPAGAARGMPVYGLRFTGQLPDVPAHG